jgi:Mn2+/Fe2+ NRAMP family transporter
MGFGAAIALAIMAVAAVQLRPKGIRVEDYPEASRLLQPIFGGWGLPLFVASLGITSFGAAVEVSLSGAYEIAQTLGWNWGKEQKARDESRFTLSYTAMLALAALPIALGVQPLKLTVFTMAISCLILPFITFPFLVLMNDPIHLGDQVNRRWANYAVAGIVGLTFVLALVAIPLQVLGGS